MSTQLLMVKRGGRLTTIDSAGAELFSPVKEGEIIKVEFTRPRNIGHLRWFFAALGLVFKAQELYATIDDLREDITIGLGYSRQYTNMFGEIVTRAQSISFSKMEESAFQQFTDKFVALVCERILPRVQDVDLHRAIAEIVGIPEEIR